MASSNPRHVRNGGRGSVSALQVRCGSHLQMGGHEASNGEKTMEVGALQGDGGFRNG